VKIVGGNADDRHRHVVDLQSGADDSRIGAEVTPPGEIGEDDDGMPPWDDVVGRQQRAPGLSAYAEQLEVVTGDQFAHRAARRGARSDDEAAKIGPGEAVVAIEVIAEVLVIVMR
jgi:hypothetical protein